MLKRKLEVAEINIIQFSFPSVDSKEDIDQLIEGKFLEKSKITDCRAFQSDILK